MTNEVIGRLNKQMTMEFSSAYLYLGFAAGLEKLSLQGAAHWYRVQANEELAHGMRIFEYLVRVSGDVEPGPVPAPGSAPGSLEAIAAAALRHEQYITASIGELMRAAVKDGDYAAQSFLKWFVDEQVEEEENARGILEAARAADGCRAALLLLDGKLGRREA